MERKSKINFSTGLYRKWYRRFDENFAARASARAKQTNIFTFKCRNATSLENIEEAMR